MTSKEQIKQVYESAISKLEQQKNVELQSLRQKVLQEKILPFNAEIDKAYQTAVQKLSDEMNKKIVELQNQFARDKEALMQAGNKKKADNQESILASETSALAYLYDSSISELKKQIDKHLGE